MARRSRKDKTEKPEAEVELDREHEVFFREVDEEIKQEKYVDLLKRYGGIALVGVILVLGGVGGWFYWQGERTAAQERASVAFAAAAKLAEQGRAEDARKAFESLAGDAPGGFAALAGMRAADLHADAGEFEAAARAYRAVAENRDAPQVLRDLATVYWALHALDDADADTMLARLEPLRAADAPWNFAATEVAGLYHMKAGRAEEARKIFQSLAGDGAAPVTMRGRAKEMLAILGNS